MPASSARRLASIVSIVLLAAPLAHAAQRTFVSANGLDTNPCTLALPCRSFSAAMGNTSAGGEILVLDSAGYGPVTIGQSVSIIAPPGVYAGVSVSSGTGITIAGSSVIVALRGLTVNAVGGTDGIVFLQGSQLHVERVLVSGFSGVGLDVKADASTTTIDDTIVENNGIGIRIGAPTTAARAYLSGVRASLNGDGIRATDKSVVNVHNSVAAKNFNGIHANTQSSASGASAEINITATLVTHNSNAGVRTIAAVGTTVLARVAGSTITSTQNNGIASFGPNQILTRGDNTVIGNVAGETFDGSFAPK